MTLGKHRASAITLCIVVTVMRSVMFSDHCQKCGHFETLVDFHFVSFGKFEYEDNYCKYQIF